jgi:peptidoglycan/xylan/chitin deacetylase (PgdA/CDA1 family)
MAGSAGACAVILMYHRVAILDPDEWQLCISPAAFREHLAIIRRSFHAMSLGGLAAALDRRAVPPGAVAITLDDGCLDNLTTASAILQEFELPATFFIPTERLSERREFWWDVLERVFLSPAPLPVVLDLSAGTSDRFMTATPADRLATHRTVAGHVRTLGWRDRDAVMQRILDWSGIDTTPRDTHRPMISEEVRELAHRPGHDIGAHGVHHVGLPALPTELKRREMLESKATLERLLDVRVTAFAYPYGQCDEESGDLAAEIFDVAVTTRAACVTAADHRSVLPRVDANYLTSNGLLRILESIA